jgi:hypothetical protein
MVFSLIQTDVRTSAVKKQNTARSLVIDVSKIYKYYWFETSIGSNNKKTEIR